MANETAELENRRDEIETKAAEYEARVEKFAQQADVLAKSAQAVEHAAKFIKLKGEVGSRDDQGMANAYALLGKAVEDMNDAVAQLHMSNQPGEAQNNMETEPAELE